MQISARIATLLAAAVFTWMIAAAAQEKFPRVWRPAIPAGLDAYLPIPAENELTPEKVALGRRLFFDTILSRDGSLSCATCHDPQRAFTDGRSVARGVAGRPGKRNTPVIFNRAYGKSHFFDGRATTLEEQALEPISNPDEFDTTLDEVVGRLRRNAQYAAEFRTAFGREPNAADLGRALASFTRTILSGDSRFDRYVRGDGTALSEQEREGLRIFRGKGNCAACHVGPLFSDEEFHNTGAAWRKGRLVDAGRAAVTRSVKNRGAFKTPTLREIARTAPYMHDGSLTTLEDVVEFYNRGGNANPHLDVELRPLNLTPDEKAALLAFLKALSGTISEGAGAMR